MGVWGVCGSGGGLWEDEEWLQFWECEASLLAVPVYCLLGVYLAATRRSGVHPEGVRALATSAALLCQVLLPLLVFFDTTDLTFGDWLAWSTTILFWTTSLTTWRHTPLLSATLLLIPARLPSTWSAAVRLGGKWDTPSFAHLAETTLCFFISLLLANTPTPSLPGKWLFTWVVPLLRKGSMRTLDLSDTFTPPVHDKLETFAVNLLTYEFDLRRALLKTYKRNFILLGLSRLVVGLSVFCLPLLLRAFLDYLTTDGVTWQGWLYVLGLSMVVIVPSVLREYHTYRMKVLELSIRDVVVHAINQQTMRLPEAVKLQAFRATSTPTLISAECNDIADLPKSIFEIPVKCVQICVGLYLLYVEVHWAFLPGVAVVLAVLAANTRTAYRVSQTATEARAKSETRAKKETALLSNMPALKCNGWQNLAADIIGVARDDELLALQRRQNYDAMCAFFYYTAPVLVSFVVLVSYRGIYEHTPLSPARLVASLILFHVLIQPINDLPYEATRRSQIQRSLNSVEGYLSIPPQRMMKDGPRCLRAVGIFSWSDVATKESSVTVDVTLASGEYVGVLGCKGAGKSSLLWALAGEMLLDEGRYERSASLAFAPATPSVFTGTLLENILVGGQYDEDRYQQVTAAVSLPKHLAEPSMLITPADPTLLLVHYIKICLARALYRDADLLLLDDPYEYLSADEAEVLHDYLNTHRKTLVVTTRRFRLLRDCTKIIEMSGGEQHNTDPAVVVCGISDTIRQAVVSAALGLVLSCVGVEEREIVVARPKRYESAEPGAGEGAVINVPSTKRVQILSIRSFLYSKVGASTAATMLASLVVMQGAGAFADWWMCRWIDNGSFSDWTYMLVFGLVTLGHIGAALIKCFAQAFGGMKLNEGTHASLLESIMGAPDSYFRANLLNNLLLCFSEDLHVIDEDLPLHLGELTLLCVRLAGIVSILIIFDPWTVLGTVPVAVLFFFARGYFQSTMRDLKRLGAEAEVGLMTYEAEVTAGSAALKVNSDFVFKKCQAALGDSQRVAHSVTAALCWLRLRLQVVSHICVTTCAAVAVARHRHDAHDVAISGLAIFYSYVMAGCMSSLVVTLSELQAAMLSVQRVSEHCSMEQDDASDTGSSQRLYPKTGHISFKRVTVSIGTPTGTCKQWCSYPKAFDGILCQHRGEVSGNHWSCCGSTAEKGKCMPPFAKHVQNHTGEYRRRVPHITVSDMSFSIPSGKTVALLGKSGAGKTTVMELLLKLQSPSGGTIELDGKSYEFMPKSSVRKAVQLLGSAPLLLDGTIHVNLDPSGGCTRKICEEVLSLVRLGGYPLHYNIGERGRRLSDAEKQLLCVARVLLRGLARKRDRNAPAVRVLLLDNALCHCGLEEELRVMRVLREHFKKATFVVVTNKIDVVTGCDSVLMVEGGGLVEGKEACNTMLHEVFQSGGVTAQLASPLHHRSSSSQSSFDFRRSLQTEDLMSLNFGATDAGSAHTADSVHKTTKRDKLRQSLQF